MKEQGQAAIAHQLHHRLQAAAAQPVTLTITPTDAQLDSMGRIQLRAQARCHGLAQKAKSVPELKQRLKEHFKSTPK